MTFRNYVATASEKEIVIVEGAVHGKSFHIDPERCLHKVSEFFEKYDG